MRTILGFIERLFPDSIFLRIKFRIKMGKPLHLRHPRTFNEKLQWLKLHDRNPEYTNLVDKYEVKNVVANLIGEQYIIPTYGVWNSFDEIDFDSLPDQFVLKCTHDSGGIVMCPDKEKLDIDAARDKINKCMKRNYYWVGREWPYKNVKPRIIAEKYLVDESGYELKDYKVHNFNEKPKVIQVDYSRFSNHMKNLYSTEWQYIEVAMNYPTDPNYQIEKPKKLDEMLLLAKKLSKEIPYLRTDFYSIEDKLFFGELTFYPGSGFMPFDPQNFDCEFGSWLKLPGGGYIVSASNVCLWIHPEVERAKKKELTDYKFMCFNGQVKCCFTCTDRFSEGGLKVTFYDRDWNRMPFTRHYPAAEENIAKPEQYEQMIHFSEILSKEIPFVRVDFYEDNGHLYFGELTFYPGDGMEEFTPDKWDYLLGEMLTLPQTTGVRK